MLSEGEVYDKILAPVQMHYYQMYVKLASSITLKEEAYLGLPEGFEVHEQETCDCGLKQVFWAWYTWIDGHLMRTPTSLQG